MAKPTNRKLNYKIFKINERLDIAQETLVNCKDAVQRNNTDQFEEMLKSSYENVQNAYIELRKFAAEFIPNKLEIENMLSKEALNYDIKISILKNRTIKIDMPIILPFHLSKQIRLYKNNSNEEKILDTIEKTDAFLASLQLAINEFCDTQSIDYSFYKDTTLLFVNTFDRKFSADKIPDSDNYSYKSITDSIANAFCFYCDSALHMDFIYTSRIGNDTFTTAYLIPNLSVAEGLMSMVVNDAIGDNIIPMQPQKKEQKMVA